MGVGRAGFSICFLILLFVLVVGSSEAKRRTAKTFFSNRAYEVAMEIDEDTAEQVWIQCRQELMEMNYAVEEFDLCFTEEEMSGSSEMNPKAALLLKRNVHKAINSLAPQMKESLLDCLRTKNLIFSVSGDEVPSKSWFIKYLELLFGWSNHSRRHLANVPQLTIETSPDSAPGPDQDPALVDSGIYYGPAPGYYPSPAGSQLRRPKQLSKTPEDASSPPDNMGSLLPPSPAKRSPPKRPPPKPHVAQSEPESPPKKPEDSSKKAIALASAAVAVLSFATLVLLCCLNVRRNKVGPRDQQRDKKPLLTLSDFSAGSSQQSLSINSSGKDFSDNSNLIGQHPSFSTDDHNSVSEATAGGPTPLPLLKPPPGRLAPPHALAPALAPAPTPAPPPPGPPPPPPPKPPAKPGPRPPPPPKIVRPPPMPPKSSAANSKLPPLGPHHRKNTASGEGDDVTGESDAPKTKLKPFFWDKVLASPDESMVWHELSAGSFQFNEEMIESLFGYTNVEKNKNDSKKESASSEPQYIQIINPKKAQNLSILLRALNVTTEEVYDALKEGNELPAELLQTLLKMAPTPDEELKLRLFSGNTSQLGPAERFLKVLVEIPFAFKRMEALLFMSSLQEEVSSIKESFAALEVACKELRNSRLFLKLLEAVLKTGNRMNDGTFRGGAQAFKLDTLLKLSDVKGIDGKTTLLHFVVLEIIRSEGIRAARAPRESKSFSSLKSDDLTEDPSNETEHFRTLGLQVVSGLSNELENVKKAAIIDADSLTSTVSNLGHSLLKTRDFLRKDMSNLQEESDFHRSLASFVEHAEVDITWMLEEENRIMTLVRSTVDYFHGHSGKDEGLRLFAIVRDFLKILDKVCNEVRKSTIKPTKNPKTEAPTVSAPPEVHQSSLQDMRQKLFPVIAERRMDNSSSSSSDDDSPSS
ncbi:formin-like protein 3 [Vitis riparia]|uniref:formin-like protein 3 n=1 Tax=Vitis riparia TaxID=96939 RepID=UPI00155AFE5E|nr:formin-like protein 3 [Vitis riparia]